MKLFLSLLLFSLISSAGIGTTCQAASYLDFDDFPATTGAAPDDSPSWEYVSNVTNSQPIAEEGMTCGWKSKTVAPDGVHWFYAAQFPTCDPEKGFSTFGFLAVSNQGHKGNALQYIVTGGKIADASSTANGCIVHGTELYNIESYTGKQDVSKDGVIGHPYLIFKKLNDTLSAENTLPFAEAKKANRLSFYLWRSSDNTNGIGGEGHAVQKTFQVGVYRDQGAPRQAYLFNYTIQGGGWAKFQLEERASELNSGDENARVVDGLLSSTWKFYLTSKPFSGSDVPPYAYLYDDIVFSRDTYKPQNNETIANIAIMLRDDTKSWEISFNDKYQDSPYAFATYELRYSLTAPITNENWQQATPAQILKDPRFSIQGRNDGKFQKWWPYFQDVWAPFQLQPQDAARLEPGTTVYFAIKDISQQEGALSEPVDGINGMSEKHEGGRSYTTHADLFDFNTDKGALPYIKRISYTVAEGWKKK